MGLRLRLSDFTVLRTNDHTITTVEPATIATILLHNNYTQIYASIIHQGVIPITSQPFI